MVASPTTVAATLIASVLLAVAGAWTVTPIDFGRTGLVGAFPLEYLIAIALLGLGTALTAVIQGPRWLQMTNVLAALGVSTGAAILAVSRRGTPIDWLRAGIIDTAGPRRGGSGLDLWTSSLASVLNTIGVTRSVSVVLAANLLPVIGMALAGYLIALRCGSGSGAWLAPIGIAAWGLSLGDALSHVGPASLFAMSVLALTFPEEFSRAPTNAARLAAALASIALGLIAPPLAVACALVLLYRHRTGFGHSSWTPWSAVLVAAALAGVLVPQATGSADGRVAELIRLAEESLHSGGPWAAPAGAPALALVFALIVLVVVGILTTRMNSPYRGDAQVVGFVLGLASIIAFWGSPAVPAALLVSVPYLIAVCAPLMRGISEPESRAVWAGATVVMLCLSGIAFRYQNAAVTSVRVSDLAAMAEIENLVRDDEVVLVVGDNVPWDRLEQLPTTRLIVPGGDTAANLAQVRDVAHENPDSILFLPSSGEASRKIRGDQLGNGEFTQRLMSDGSMALEWVQGSAVILRPSGAN